MLRTKCVRKVVWMCTIATPASASDMFAHRHIPRRAVPNYEATISKKKKYISRGGGEDAMIVSLRAHPSQWPWRLHLHNTWAHRPIQMELYMREVPVQAKRRGGPEELQSEDVADFNTVRITGGAGTSASGSAPGDTTMHTTLWNPDGWWWGCRGVSKDDNTDGMESESSSGEVVMGDVSKGGAGPN